MTNLFSTFSQKFVSLVLRIKYIFLKGELSIDSISYVDHLVSKGGIIEIQWEAQNCYKIEVVNGQAYPGNCKGIRISMNQNPTVIVFKGTKNREITKVIHFNEDRTSLINKFTYESMTEAVRPRLDEGSNLRVTLKSKTNQPSESTERLSTNNLILSHTNVDPIIPLIQEIKNIEHLNFEKEKYTDYETPILRKP